MRVNPIYTYNRFSSAQKNKQVNFGLIENEENTKRVLPKNSDYRIPFNTQWEHLKKHDAITVTSEGDKAWARLNPGFEDMYGRLDGKNFMDHDYLANLENQRRFDSFYYTLEHCDDKRNGIKPSENYCTTEDTRSAYDKATEDGFGVKVW